MNAVPAPTRPRRAAGMVEVGGPVPLSTTEFPDHPAAVLYLQGCPWKCVYCQSPSLQPRPIAPPIPWPEVEAFLESRRRSLHAVVFSGGEPTLQAGLGRSIDHVRRMGFAAGMQTAGIYPRRLGQVLPKLDWIALDVKAPFANYSRITRRLTGGSAVRESLDLVLASGVPHEVRTTWHPAVLDEGELESLARSLARRGVRRFALQCFEPGSCREAALLADPAPVPPPALVETLRDLFPTFTLRAPGAEAR